MPAEASTILLLSFLPVLASVGGAAFAVWRPPGNKIRGLIQHFAAGVVFSVVSLELLPNIVQRHLPWEVAIGFAMGVAVMMVMKHLTRGKGKTPYGLLAAVAVDILIDGLLMGVGFTAGAKEGLLLTIAITVEVLSLALAVAAGLGKLGTAPLRTIAFVAGLSLLLLVGTFLGVTLLRSFSPEAMELTLALEW